MSRNPYSPPIDPKATGETGTPIKFDGQVTVDDLAALIRVPRIITVLRVLYVVIMSPFAIMAIAIIVFDRSNWVAGFGVLAMVLFIAGIVVAANLMASRKRRAKRLATTHAGLVGPVRGELNTLGLTIFNEGAEEFQQISWAAFPEVAVNRHGIRLDWRMEDFAFVAIPATAIDNFDLRQIREQIHRFRATTAEPPIYQSVANWNAAPDDALRFQNLIPSDSGPPNGASLAMWFALSVSGISALAIVIALMSGQDEYVVHLILVAVFAAVAAYVAGEHRHKANLAWHQWGWLTRTGCETHIPGRTCRFDWTDTKLIEIDADQFKATFADDTFVRVTPDDLIEGDWETLVDWIREKD